MSLRISHNGTGIYEITSSQLTGTPALAGFGFVLGMKFKKYE